MSESDFLDHPFSASAEVRILGYGLRIFCIIFAGR